MFTSGVGGIDSILPIGGIGATRKRKRSFAITELPTAPTSAPVTPRVLGVTSSASHAIPNPNLLIQTQAAAVFVKNPLDLSEVTNVTDRNRLEHVDRTFCGLSDEMPALTKTKVKLILGSHYRLQYDWDDAVFNPSVFALAKRFDQDYIKDISIAKQGLVFTVWASVEMEAQGLSRPTKRSRIDTDDNTTAMDIH